ncbi:MULTISPECIES: hypothetical protein [unclassified Streptomyces]|uniref:hypothetical protein n=1 Tax=unclassified Streptomyces TaxID=2593676 RepID=UPI00131C8B46|nr:MULTISPECIES: hypothetical protein [unclassified Streptomyces]
MDLVRASLEPAANTARLRTEHPACQVVIRVVESDLAAGGADHVNMLAIGAGVAAAGLTAWLAQERDRDTADIISEFEKAAASRGFASAPLDAQDTADRPHRHGPDRGVHGPALS